MIINYPQATKYSDSFLKKIRKDREWVFSWAIDHAAVEGTVYPEDDGDFVNAIVSIQIAVFGDDSPSDIDGFLGPSTYRRMMTYVESLQPVETASEPVTTHDYMIFAGDKIPVPGVEIVSFDEVNSLSFVDSTKKGYYHWPRPIDDLLHTNSAYAYLLGTIHWDAALSAKSAFRILKSRGYSSCFGIDNPDKETGVVKVFEWLDPGLYRGAHAGTKANRASVSSFDLSNAVYTKYADRYFKSSNILRPVITPRFHHTKKTMLGMYKGQVVALLRILKALAARTGLPLVFPVDDVGEPIRAVYDDLFTKKYHGAHTHMHITRKKWDVAGLEDQIIILMLTDQDLFIEFPSLVECFRLQDSRWAKWLDNKKDRWQWDEIGWRTNVS
jgi:hypothetical protein